MMINMAKQGRYGCTAVVIAVLLYQVRARSTAGKAWRACRRQVSSPKARLAASPEDASPRMLCASENFFGEGGFAYVKWTSFSCA